MGLVHPLYKWKCKIGFEIKNSVINMHIKRWGRVVWNGLIMKRTTVAPIRKNKLIWIDGMKKGIEKPKITLAKVVKRAYQNMT